MADPQEWDFQLWDQYPNEKVMLTHRFLQWQVADEYGRPTYWTKVGSRTTPEGWPQNYFRNMSACSQAGECQDDGNCLFSCLVV